MKTYYKVKIIQGVWYWQGQANRPEIDRSPVGEVESHRPRGAAKKKKKVYFQHLLKNPKTCCFSACIPIGQHQWERVLAPREHGVRAPSNGMVPFIPCVLKTMVLPSFTLSLAHLGFCVRLTFRFVSALNLILDTLKAINS